MALFNVSGKMTLGIEERKFSKKVEAKSEGMAKHKTYALLGSACGLTRNKIKIDKVEKATG